MLSMTFDEDFTAGEIDQPERNDVRRLTGGQGHVLTYLGEHWGMGAPRFTEDGIRAFCRTNRS